MSSSKNLSARGHCFICGKQFDAKYKPNVGWAVTCSILCRNRFGALQRKDTNSPYWKGDRATYYSIHEWIRKNKKKPEKCEKCNEKKKLDAANISGKYLRNLDDWEYLCRRCHQTKDGRLTRRDKKTGRIIAKVKIATNPDHAFIGNAPAFISSIRSLR